jgi:hypothetical protein
VPAASGEPHETADERDQQGQDGGQRGGQAETALACGQAEREGGRHARAPGKSREKRIDLTRYLHAARNGRFCAYPDFRSFRAIWGRLRERHRRSPRPAASRDHVFLPGGRWDATTAATSEENPITRGEGGR